jgi:adenosyl cobinamide kinase/adenosyl cobinamide phosphate guanylyltransferase
MWLHVCILQRVAEDQLDHAQAQAREANAVKDMMEQQLLALMETGGSAEAALREEKKMRAEVEAKLAAMESQYESAVFVLNERETGVVTERLLQKQKQLRSHVREVEQALRAREEDEVCGVTAL